MARRALPGSCDVGVSVRLWTTPRGSLTGCTLGLVANGKSDGQVLPEIVRVAQLGSSSREARAVRSAARRGELVRVGPGAFVRAPEWAACDERQRYVLQVVARVPRLAGRVAASHWSAAALHGLPSLEHWPVGLSVVDPARATTQSVSGVLRRAGSLPDDDVVLVHDVRATSTERTVTDLALEVDFARAVVVLDSVLHARAASTDGIAARLQRHADRGGRGVVGARRALGFASPRAESPWESFTRVQLHRLGAPVPVLQQEFPLHGRVARVDFWFPVQGVVLEFDGRAKYLDAALLGGRSTAEVVVAEKRREDELRRAHAELVRAVLRVDASEVRSLSTFRRLLLQVGVPCAS